MSVLVSERNAAAFSTDDIPEGHGGVIPPEVGAYKPLKAAAEKYLDLSGRYSEASRKVHALLAEVSGAMASDRHALEVAVVAGEDDPGTPALDALADRITTAKRTALGLSDGLNAAHRDLVDALREHRDDFEAQLDLDQSARRQEAAELIAALDANLRAAGAPAAALRWYRQTTDPARSWGGLAHLHIPEPVVTLPGGTAPLAHVLHGLREAA
jgi:hypothetical protein